MAYINFGSGFNITSTDAVDKRLVMTKAEMLAIKKAKMPTLYFTLCSDDSQFYVYDKTATPSAETGYYVVANKSILDRLTAAEQGITDANTAIGIINGRLASEFVTKSYLQEQGYVNAENVEQTMAEKMPGAMKKALEDETLGTELVTNMFDNEHFALNVDKKIDLSLSLIQAVESV